MPEPDNTKTIIFDLVQLEKLGAEFERRWLLNPATRPIDVLREIDVEDHPLYLPQLTKLAEDLKRNRPVGDETQLGVEMLSVEQTAIFGDGVHHSLLATKMLVDGDTSEKSGRSGDSSRLAQTDDSRSRSGGGHGRTAPRPERIDQFRILKELGTGAFGVVYLAEDESLQRKVAIKVPKVSDPARSASYINEARKAAAIDCRGIVPIYHVGSTADGVPFVVQKLIDGPSLRFLLTRYGSLPPAHAVTLMRDVSLALLSAHRLGIFHRDLKPDNVLIDSTGVPWIADFGLAISADEQAKRKGEIAGTLIYMSPEQIQGRADWLDGRSDIWALGVMLYELLVGRPPFDGQTRQALMEQICHREPIPLQQRAAILSADLNDVFERCCAKSPRDRYSSVDELAADLSLLIEHGLSTLPIDGGTLRFEQPISQYSSIHSSGGTFGSRNSGGVPAGGILTRRTTGGSTHLSSGPATHGSSHLRRSSGTGQADSLAAEGVGDSNQLETGQQPTASASPLATTARIVALASAIAICGGLGLAWWQGSPGTTLARTIPDPPAPGAVITSSGLNPQQSQPSLTLDTNPDGGSPQPASNSVPLDPAIANANGSAEFPYVVASDGTGTHQTIAEAVLASAPGSFIQVRPGTYLESLKLTRPLHLIGDDDPEKCAILGIDEPPVEVTCGLGTVRMVGFAIRGDGRRSGKEFNAVDLVGGKLQLENCSVTTSTFNGVKLKPGTSLSAVKCRFLESSAFAVSGKNHLAMDLTDCQFFASGVQAVEGSASIEGCDFYGAEGVYVEQSDRKPTVITRSRFHDSTRYGVTASEAGEIKLSQSIFDGGSIGLQTKLGRIEASACKLVGLQQSLAIVGGTIIATQGTDLINGQVGCGVIDGELRLSDCRIGPQSKSGIYVIGPARIVLEKTEIQDCRNSGIAMESGTLEMVDCSITDCGDTGLSLVEGFQLGQIRRLRLSDNGTAGIFMESGDFVGHEMEITGSDVGMIVSNVTEQPMTIDLHQPRFEGLTLVAQVDGRVTMKVLQATFVGHDPATSMEVAGAADVQIVEPIVR